ncbi:MAG: type II toxin-antitoxin system HicB family antitoxin [Bacteroidota bacterium]
MPNFIQYKGFTGTAEYNPDDHLFHGNLVGVEATVLYHGETVAEFEQAFREAVDDYIDYCQEKGVDPFKNYSGKFSLRMDPNLHRALTDRAAATGQSINQIAIEAIKAHLKH